MCIFNTFRSDTSGSTIITVLVITTIITTTLLALLTFLGYQRRFLLQKEHFLKAKYAVESGINLAIYDLQEDWRQGPWKHDRGFWKVMASNDSVRVEQRRWGGFLRLSAHSQNRGKQPYRRETLLGMYPLPAFGNAVVINPNYYALVVTGDTRIYGTALVGLSGVKRESLRGRPYTGSALVYGDITKTNIDSRPEIDTDYLDELFRGFHSLLDKTQYAKLQDFRPDSGNVIDFSRLNLRTPVYVDTQTINERHWRIVGPVNLISREPLWVRQKLSLENQVRLLCKADISLERGGIFRDVILFAGGRLRLRKTQAEFGQFFSEQSITLKDSLVADYPSLALVYADLDTAKINVAARAEISGTVVCVPKAQSIVPTTNRSAVWIAPNAVVNGAVYSGNLVTLEGAVNGAVITDRFHFYHSPTHYYNWIRDGVIHRERLNHYFSLPLFFYSDEPRLKTLGETDE